MLILSFSSIPLSVYSLLQFPFHSLSWHFSLLSHSSPKKLLLLESFLTKMEKRKIFTPELKNTLICWGSKWMTSITNLAVPPICLNCSLTGFVWIVSNGKNVILSPRCSFKYWIQSLAVCSTSTTIESMLLPSTLVIAMAYLKIRKFFLTCSPLLVAGPVIGGRQGWKKHQPPRNFLSVKIYRFFQTIFRFHRQSLKQTISLKCVGGLWSIINNFITVVSVIIFVLAKPHLSMNTGNNELSFIQLVHFILCLVSYKSCIQKFSRNCSSWGLPFGPTVIQIKIKILVFSFPFAESFQLYNQGSQKGKNIFNLWLVVPTYLATCSARNFLQRGGKTGRTENIW